MLYCSLGGMALKKDILGVRFDDVSRQEAAQLGAAMLEQDQFHYVVTPNPEFILAAEKDADLRQVLNSADPGHPRRHWCGLFGQDTGHTPEGAGSRYRICR